MTGSEKTRLQSVDRSTLHSLNEVKLDPSLPYEQRMKSYVEQIGDPYCYLDGDMVVSLGFSDTGGSLKDRLGALGVNMEGRSY